MWIRGVVCCALCWLLAAGGSPLCAETGAGSSPRLNPMLEDLEPNRWVVLHRQQADDEVRFHRQEHGGSCFDTRRGRLILFGSNTHGRDWQNSPLVFDPVSCKWSRLYPDDGLSTYAVTGEGLPVAGERGDHPWAMHTFGAVVYDPERDEMVVCNYPQHMVPGRFTDALSHLWPRVKKHPTWTFDLASEQWRPLPCKPEHFFPYCAVYDSDRRVIVGYRPDGIYQLEGEPRAWERVAAKGFFGWHTNAVYDSVNKAVLVFGSNENSNDVVAYRPATGEHRKMPTPGVRPPKDQHNPMCFDPVAARLVIVVDRALDSGTKHGETWLYDLAEDNWTQLPEATLPFASGMNYTMEYDPGHKECLLVATSPTQDGSATTVFALRVALRQRVGE